ncbi:MAG: alpha/beta fold hydrolase [Desulfosarcina sp.]|nr:alpha/beta fold hydrolase [Desulfosarcina sp.]
MLDSYLSESESRVSGIRKGCEKKIVWHDDQRRQRDLAVVYIHGFSASRMEVWPLCDHLAEAMGANLFYTRLNGHGQDGDALARATVQDWMDDGMEAVDIGQRLGEKVILLGTSTGGTLAAWLAAQPSVAARIHRLILISPNFFPKNPLAAAALWPPTLRLFESFFGGWRCFIVSNATQARFWTMRYPLKAIATMMQLVHLSWRIDFKIAAMPVLMMVNPWDRVINVTLAVMRYLAFPSSQKKLVLFRGNKDLGRHVLAGDILAPESTARAVAIIRSYLNSRP